MKTVLLIDFGSTFTKLTAVDLDEERIIGTSKSFTTVETDINEGYKNALERLQLNTGIKEWSDVYACSSAAGGLKMIAIGFVPELTSEAAKRAALSAGAKILRTYSNELSKSELDEINLLRPDIILLTGGTDGGNSKIIINNAMKLSKLNLQVPIVVAGNKSASDEVREILENNNKEVIICNNVMPSLNILDIESARAAIREVFMKRIIKAKGLTKVEKLLNGILMPTPIAVLNAANILANGFEDENGIGEIIIVDIGGATTDVHSVAEGKPDEVNVILKGLDEPVLKRTVEGDLGLRYSAEALIDAVGMNKVMNKSKLSREEIQVCLQKIKNNPDILPEKNSLLEKFDLAIASIAVEESFSRHCGNLEIVYTPMGSVYQQVGKDLRKVINIIGTGGPIINSRDSLSILENSKQKANNLMSLKPQKPKYYLDKKYIMAAMGLLSEFYPKTALKILKKEITEI